MSKATSREIRLASRPDGMPTADNFTLSQIELGPPQDGQVLVRNRYTSVDRGGIPNWNAASGVLI